MNVADLKIVRLTGTVGEQGASYGETERELIAEALARWRDSVARDRLEPETWASVLTGRVGYAQAMRRHAPRFLDFMRGIAAGANQPLNQLIASNMMDEDWQLRPRLRPGGVAALEPLEACSVVAGPTGSGHAGGQNMDLQPWGEGLQRIVQMDSGTAAGTIYWAALAHVPTCAVSSDGIGMLLNTVSQLPVHADGLPLCALQFELMHVADRAAGESFLKSVRHASGQAFTLTDKDGIDCYECGADGALEIDADSRRIYTHTNHPLRDQRLRDSIDAVDQGMLDVRGSTASRLQQIREAIADCPALSVDRIRQALSSRADPELPVSREARDAHGRPIGYTCFSVVYDYQPDSPVRLHVAPGPPSETEFKTIDLE